MIIRPITVLLTCEHGGNEVPANYRKLFAPHRQLLKTHRGWDPGTKELAEQWHQQRGCVLQVATTTRLLVDLNRSAHHRSVFSEITRSLPQAEKEELLSSHHTPHRTRVMEAVSAAIASGQRVVHIGVHSFTPELNGEVRNADISLLYNPVAAWESSIARQWREVLRCSSVKPRVRLNYPYRGNSDGLTTTLRKAFPADRYAGIEIELNQAIPIAGGRAWQTYRDICIESLSEVLR